MPEATPEITGHYVTVDGTRIYYDECGSGEPTIVCIHTAGACSIEFRYFLPEMAARGFRAIALDLPGHGKSYPHKWEPFRKMADYGEFVWEFVKAVLPDEKPIIAGSSIGGCMTYNIACNHSEEIKAALAWEGIPYSQEVNVCWFMEYQEETSWFPAWPDIIGRCGGVTLQTKDSSNPDLKNEFIWQHRYSHQSIGAGDLQCWVENDLRGKLENITCPTMVFKGEDDFWVPEEMLDEIVASVPNGLAEKIIGSKMAHYPMMEQPELLADICVDFLKRRDLI